MSRTTGKKADAAGKGNPMLVGVLVGLIVGVGLAAGLAWYLMKSPSPFVSKEQVTVNKPQAEERIKAEASEVVKRGTLAQPASGVGDGKPRFEFYKVLTDKQDAAALPGQTTAKSPVAKPAADAGKPVYYLQAGAFANEAEAEKLKASLIIDGMEVTVLAVTTPEKILLHKVRVGPYQGADEMNRARAKLQLKGIASTPVRG
jgi:cell division protein FtsN